MSTFDEDDVDRHLVDTEETVCKIGDQAAAKEFNDLKLYEAAPTEYSGLLASLKVRVVERDNHGKDKIKLPSMSLAFWGLTCVRGMS